MRDKDRRVRDGRRMEGKDLPCAGSLPKMAAGAMIEPCWKPGAFMGKVGSTDLGKVSFSDALIIIWVLILSADSSPSWCCFYLSDRQLSPCCPHVLTFLLLSSVCGFCWTSWEVSG